MTPLMGPGAAGAAALLLGKVTLLLCVAALLLRLLHDAAAAVRHLVLFAAVCGTVLLAGSQILLPVWELPVPGLELPLPEAGLAGPVTRDAVPLPLTGISTDVANVATLAFTAAAESGSRRPSAGATALGLWGAGALLLLLRAIWGALAARRLVRRAAVIADPRAANALAAACGALGVRRRVRLVEAPAGAGPATWGIFSPYILLPPESVAWPERRLRIVLMHETAHVARRDCATQLVAACVQALLWVHPGVWWAVQRLREERERACDELVLRQGVRPHSYAAELLEVVRWHVRLSPAAALSMAAPSRLQRRLRAILAGQVPQPWDRRSRRFGMGIVMALSAGTLALGAAQPAARVPPSAAAASATAPLAGAPSIVPLLPETARPAPSPSPTDSVLVALEPAATASGEESAARSAPASPEAVVLADGSARQAAGDVAGQQRPEVWRTADRLTGPARLSSCWGRPDAAGPPTLILLFAGTLREPAWLRLVPSLPAARRAASAASDDGGMNCLNAAHVGVGLAGVWDGTTTVTIHYSPGVRLLLDAPPGRAREVRLPSGTAPLLCRLSARGGEYDLTCRAEDRNQY
jgi:beta-lactamase regulating signal transducer with metallopeptidase domain